MNCVLSLQTRKMAKCLVIGDPHIRTVEVEFTDIMLDEIVEIAQQKKPDFIVVLGDTLHSNFKIDANPLCRAVNWLGRLVDIAPLVLLIGNHDIKHNKLRIDLEKKPEHPFTALKRWKDTIVVDKPTIFEFKGQKFCGVPYIPVGYFHDAIKDIPALEMTAFFTHPELRGVKYKLTDKEPADCPDVWPPEYPPNFAGHIHEYQVVASNLVFIGTPGQQDHGANKDKAVAIIDFSGEKFEMERICLQKIPIRSEHEFDSGDITGILGILKELRESTRIHLTKITFRGTQTSIKALEKSGPYRELKAMKNVVLHPIPTDAGIESTIVEASILPKSLGFLDTVTEMYKHDLEMLKLINELK